MQQDDETTAYQLRRMLVEKGVQISLRTVLRCRTTLGWTFRGSAYCQMIREENKVKRLHEILSKVRASTGGKRQRRPQSN